MDDVKIKTPEVTLAETNELLDQQLITVQQESFKDIKTSPFDQIRHEDQNGEYWLARELQTLLGYVEWRKFEDTIERAKTAIANIDGNSDDHIVGTAKMVSIGSGAQRTVKDYRLTRYGAYITAMNGDPRKTEIAAAQTYFAVKTRQAELQTKPMSLAQQLAVQAQLNLQFEEQLNEQAARLNQHTQQLQQQSADIKRLQQAHNGMSLRHEMRDNEQQDQLDRHEADITDLQKNMYELLTEKADISQDMDAFISAVVRIYYQHIKDQTDQYKTAWKDFYNAIAEEAGRPKGYIQSLKTRQRNTLMNSGIAKTTAEKRVTGKTIVNSNQNLKTAAIAVMARISEDINAHKEEEEQSL